MNVHSGDVDVSGDSKDPLLRCLLFLSGLFDREVSVDSALAGLPLVNGRLTPDLFIEAAQRAGYGAAIVKRPLAKIHPIALPAILLLKDQGACVLLQKKRGKRADIYDPVTGTQTTIRLRSLAPSYEGHSILVKPEAQLAADVVQASSEFRGHWFWGAVAKLWPAYVRVILAAALVNILALASPLFIMNVYDRVLPNKAVSTLWVLASGVCLAILFDFLFRNIRSWLTNAAGRRADVLLATRLFSHAMSLKLGDRPETTGSFASQLREFDAVRDFFTSSTLATLTDLCFFGLFVFVIYQIGGPIAAVPVIGAALVVIFGLAIQLPLRSAARKTQKEAAQRHSLLVESIAGLETIKTLRAEGVLQRLWEGLVGKTAKTMERSRKLQALITNVTTAVQQMVTIGVVLAGTYMFDAGQITMGAIIACVILAGRSVAPFGQFASLLARSQQSFAALSTLNALMRLESERPLGKNFVNTDIEPGLIEFRGVSMTYPNSPTPALSEFNLTIRPGERVGIIGKIGSGKTTIGRLLAGIYHAQTGHLLIDGVDIRQHHPHTVRRAIGVAGQDSDLFHGTVRSNILLGAGDVSDEEFLSATRLSGVDDFTMKHPSGYDMEVGERGALLSGGQRQSVCLARLFIRRPRIAFLDEPSGSMDLASERALIGELKSSFSSDQTLIVSTHRYSMLELVDRLVVIANGKVAADGPKDRVLKALKDRLASG
ncbi:type I secretion system permease/ATPase [Anderseniella sp. Alg231-50]|uniref:type I secretion system permease/ATPase n=1 Tax=Anderseniella sp. Alg231-50 TaxID=1922226 RepID=UPI000D54C2D2